MRFQGSFLMMYRLDTNEPLMRSSLVAEPLVLNVSASYIIGSYRNSFRKSSFWKSRSQECLVEQRLETVNHVEFWGLLPLTLFLNMSIGWFGRFALSTESYRTRKLGYKNLNWPRCSAWVTESLALTDGGFCQKQTLYILDYV